MCVVGDCMGAILGYDALCQSQRSSSATSSQGSIYDMPEHSPASTYCSASPVSTGAESSYSLENSKPLSSSSGDLQQGCNDSEVDVRRRSQTSPASTTSKSQTSPMFFGKEVPVSPGGYNSNLEERYGNQLSPDPLLFVQSGDATLPKVEFDVAHFFMFGSPLGVVLAQRKTLKDEQTGKCL